jgi:hypothetical protein
MYDEAIMIRFIAYSRTHPEWFTARYLDIVEAMITLDDAAPGQEAWEMLLDRFVEEVPNGDKSQDRPTKPTSWKPRFV